MNIKGSIGEEVFVKGTIEEIRITQEGTTYIVETQKPITEHEIVFLRDEEVEEKRGPGRPRKATVSDLMRKCEIIRDRKEYEE